MNQGRNTAAAIAGIAALSLAQEVDATTIRGLDSASSSGFVQDQPDSKTSIFDFRIDSSEDPFERTFLTPSRFADSPEISHTGLTFDSQNTGYTIATLSAAIPNALVRFSQLEQDQSSRSVDIFPGSAELPLRGKLDFVTIAPLPGIAFYNSEIDINPTTQNIFVSHLINENNYNSTLYELNPISGDLVGTHTIKLPDNFIHEDFAFSPNGILHVAGLFLSERKYYNMIASYENGLASDPILTVLGIRYDWYREMMVDFDHDGGLWTIMEGTEPFSNSQDIFDFYTVDKLFFYENDFREPAEIGIISYSGIDFLAGFAVIPDPTSTSAIFLGGFFMLRRRPVSSAA